MTSQISDLTSKNLNKNITLYIWIKQIRKLGNLLFFIGKDNNSSIQIVVKEKKLINDLKSINKGDLLEIKGVAKKKERTKEAIEIELKQYQLINSSKELPFELKDEININEDTRFRYRYLDLRRDISKKPLLIKHHLLQEIRNFLYKEKFVEVETPILAQKSPEGEGARCFLVSSKLGKNRYYTLPQSPQIFKQLLMIAGIGKYYQIAKSFRDEDARSNRQKEFSQLDLEMSFISVKEIRKLTEKMLKIVLKKVFGYQVIIPFPQLTYQEVISKYETDKPDLRNSLEKKQKELKFLWITDWPLFEYNKEAKKYKSFRHPFTIPKKEYIESLLNNKIKPEKVIGEAFDLVCNGEEILSGSLRIYRRGLQEKVLEILGFNQEKREKYFGYFLQALEFAAPPHGGVGFGIDRFLATILEIKNLKDLLAFPKNIDGSCSLTGTPDFIKISN